MSDPTPTPLQRLNDAARAIPLDMLGPWAIRLGAEVAAMLGLDRAGFLLACGGIWDRVHGVAPVGDA